MKYTVRNAAITLEGNTILDYVNFEINDGNHIGIVGRNGSGKTTLLKALINNDMFEEGVEEETFEIKKIGNFTIGYLEQITFEDESVTLLEEVKKSFADIIQLEKKLEQLLERMTNDNSEKNILEYTQALDRYKILGGYTYKKEYEVMLSKFGFSNEDKDKPLTSFSGGEKTKIAFIKLLLSKSDILFLDEPTNHLDVEAILWLEGYLKNYKGALVIVSHDRMFLNNIVNIIYDVSHGRVSRYVGNYEHYEVARKKDYEKALKDYERQRQEIKRLRELYERFRFKPSKASMAMSRLHRLEKMQVLEKPERIDEKTFKTNLDKMQPSAKVALTCKELVVGYDMPLAKIDLEVERGKKIGIIGANGTGKSTLLKTIQGLIKPISGKVGYGYNVDIGYFDQNLAMLDSHNTVLQEFMASHPELLEGEARSALGSFQFSGEDVNKQVEILSGGEKVRLSLCKLLFNNPNFLILDEPTNHMDIIGKQHLEDVLKMYKGTIIFVSHDRYFVKKIATDLIVFENNSATYYPFGYDDYINKIVNEKKSEDITQKTISSQKLVQKNKGNVYSSKKELNKVEAEIKDLEMMQKKLNEEFSQPEVYNNYIKVNEINRQLNKITQKLEMLYTRWEELTDEIVESTK